MEVEKMEEGVKSENHLTSAAAFVEGGIQEACDDSCSICLEAFCESEPSTVTCCKHEFHLQCILEWCQRSSQCPMCWQPISLKDPSSQELLDAIEQEKSFRANARRNTTIFHHPTLGDFELQHLPVGGTDAELEERIIQHLAAAAAMGRTRHIARREGQRNRSSAQGRPHYLVFSTHSNGPPVASVSSSPTQSIESDSASSAAVAEPTSLITVGEDSTQIVPPRSSQADQIYASASRSTVLASNHHGTSSHNQSPTQSPTDSHDKAGPSEFQSISESLKSRFNAMSMRYKESITKSTRGWKEKLFSRNTNMTDIGSEVKGEGNSGISTVSGMMERLETRDNSRTNTDSGSSSSQEANTADESTSLHDVSVPDLVNQQIPVTDCNNVVNEGTQTSCATGSAAN
ncbi:E3 ubiquitin-protein ligase RHF2A [Rhododendron vialii]|uniref:E3 ubiquitin-protein ligase RHF2A n=1 Tax=Rhododendron vialii TaxID=182163 RepID=UPI00265FC45D|nr:E3 ubiquitin-protein ligase RHF2A [Rhododendron vialii]XP_058191379.1 E3 ubiquitin-protein ligase RHF2A [Rhododendron vialii]